MLWSKGYAQFAQSNAGLREVLGRTEKRWSLRRFLSLYKPDASSYWVPLTSHGKSNQPCPLDWFAEHIVPNLSAPFVLITTDGDTSVPSDLNYETFQRIIQSPYLQIWFSQNVCKTSVSDKLKGIPLGLDLHTNRGLGNGWDLYSYLHTQSKRFLIRERHVVADCCLNLNSDSRRDIVRVARDNAQFIFLNSRVTQKKLWQLYTKNRYVLSPEGVGLDCHRTWEALYLGATVITKDIGLGHLYEGLPVFELTSWDDVVQPGFLDFVDEHVSQSDYDWRSRLDPSKWISCSL